MFSTGRTIQSDDALLFVAEAGNPAGQPVVLLHGGLGNRNDYKGLAEYLAHSCRLIAVDTRGHGSSTLGSEALNYERLARDTERVIDALQLEKPFLIGHSDGGIATIRIAAAKRCILSGIILLMAHEDPPAADLIHGIFSRLTPARWRSRFPDSVSQYQALNPAPDFDTLFEATRAMWCDTNEGNYPGALAETIQCPALVLGGEVDHLAPVEVTLKLARRVPGARLGILPFGNHIVFETHPERVAPYIMEFISTSVNRNKA